MRIEEPEYNKPQKNDISSFVDRLYETIRRQIELDQKIRNESEMNAREERLRMNKEAEEI